MPADGSSHRVRAPGRAPPRRELGTFSLSGVRDRPDCEPPPRVSAPRNGPRRGMGERGRGPERLDPALAGQRLGGAGRHRETARILAELHPGELDRPEATHPRRWRNWQTRWIQVPVGLFPWRFKSSPSHKRLRRRERAARPRPSASQCRRLDQKPRPTWLDRVHHSSVVDGVRPAFVVVAAVLTAMACTSEPRLGSNPADQDAGNERRPDEDASPGEAGDARACDPDPRARIEPDISPTCSSSPGCSGTMRSPDLTWWAPNSCAPLRVATTCQPVPRRARASSTRSAGTPPVIRPSSTCPQTPSERTDFVT